MKSSPVNFVTSKSTVALTEKVGNTSEANNTITDLLLYRMYALNKPIWKQKTPRNTRRGLLDQSEGPPHPVFCSLVQASGKAQCAGSRVCPYW